MKMNNLEISLIAIVIVLAVIVCVLIMIHKVLSELLCYELMLKTNSDEITHNVEKLSKAVENNGRYGNCIKTTPATKY